jgi:hypothetical protein
MTMTDTWCGRARSAAGGRRNWKSLDILSGVWDGINMLNIRVKQQFTMPNFTKALEAVCRKARMVPNNHASSNAFVFFGPSHG